jgi:hypothetical protein
MLHLADLFIAAPGPFLIFGALGLFAMPYYMEGDPVVAEIVGYRPMATGWRGGGARGARLDSCETTRSGRR